MSDRERNAVRRRRATLYAVPLVLAGGGVLLGARLAGAQPSRAVPRAVPQEVSSEPSVAVPVTPFRILDTRLGIGTNGSATPLGPGQTITVQIAGVETVPEDATGVILNLTANAATASGYVTAWPHGEERPTSSVLNLTPGQDLPNMITVSLGDGQLDLYNFAGSVHLIADVAAYLIPGTGSGSEGPPGPQGLSAWDEIPSGVTVTGAFAGTGGPGLSDWKIAVDLPGLAPVPLTDETVNFQSLGAQTNDPDPECTGTYVDPTAPPGKVCLYGFERQNVALMLGSPAFTASRSFLVEVYSAGGGMVSKLYGTWAYTAP